MSGVNHAMPLKESWGTPVAVCEAARLFMGGIDLDPASSEAFNSIVQAAAYYDAACDGLAPGAPWLGRVFLNPPGGTPGKAKKWWKRLVAEWQAGNVKEALYLSSALDSFQWSQSDACDVPILAFPTLVFAKRLRFLEMLDSETIVPQKNPWKPCALTWLPSADTPRRVEDLAGILSALGEPGILVEAYTRDKPPEDAAT